MKLGGADRPRSRGQKNVPAQQRLVVSPNGAYEISSAGSLRLDVRLANGAAIGVKLLAQISAEFRPAGFDRVDSLRGKLRFDFRRLHGLREPTRKPRHHFLHPFPLSHHTVPNTKL